MKTTIKSCLDFPSLVQNQVFWWLCLQTYRYKPQLTIYELLIWIISGHAKRAMGLDMKISLPKKSWRLNFNFQMILFSVEIFLGWGKVPWWFISYIELFRGQFPSEFISNQTLGRNFTVGVYFQTQECSFIDVLYLNHLMSQFSVLS